MEIYTIRRIANSHLVTMEGPEKHGLGKAREFPNVRLAAEHARECGKCSGAAVVRLMSHDNYLQSERAIPQVKPPTLY